jgi:hypothetical protein
VPKFTSDAGNVSEVEIGTDSITVSFRDGADVEVGKSWNEIAPRFDADMSPELRGEIRAALSAKPKARKARKK